MQAKIHTMRTHPDNHMISFRHGSRAVVLMGVILMLVGAALCYVAFADPEATTGTSIFLVAVGLLLLAIGAKLAFGLERVSLDLASRTWHSTSGAVFKRRAMGPLDDLEAVVLEAKEHRHGAEHFYMYRVGFLLSDGSQLHAGMDRSLESARRAARELSMRTGLPFRDLSESEEDAY